MTYQKFKPKKKKNPLLPLIGFIMMVAGGGFSFLAAPAVINFMETTTFTFGFFGQVLPMSFPAEWPAILTRSVVAAVMFMLLFTLLMALVFMVMKPPEDESDVKLEDVRKEVKARKKY